MKQLRNIFALSVAVLMGLSLTGCSEDDLSTNQYKQGVSLNAYGPNPVMRGGTLRFVGSNLEQVSEVNIPGVSAITSITIYKAGVPSEIRVEVPADGPEEGYITLKTRTGETLTTASILTFTEPIVFEGFEPALAMPGDVVTIKGDYLNLVQMVEFSDEVRVSAQDFVSHDRYALQVVVPEEAKTGKISLYTADLTVTETDDVSYQIITSEYAFMVGVPTITQIVGRKGAETGTVSAKQGETITISGEALNLIDAITFVGDEDDEAVTVTDFTSGAKEITFELPAEAPDGEIILVTRSGVEMPVGILVTVKPSGCVASPIPVKAGQQLTVSGNDMDVVSTYLFHTADGVSGGNNLTVSADKVVIAEVPEEAIEGSLQLIMANGSYVAVPFSLVKPAATAYSANPVSAGAPLTITGTDLDLVQSVTFGEATNEADGFSTSEKTLTLTVPMAATSGKPLLNLANGTSIEAPELSIAEALFCYATLLPDEDDEVKAGNAMMLAVANGDKLTGVEINGTACQWILTGDNKSQLIIGIPDNAGTGSKVRLISSNGEITYTIDIQSSAEVNTVLWTGMADLAGWSWNWQIGDGTEGANNPAMFADMGLQEGDLIRVYLTAYNDWWQVQFFDGHWGGQTEIGNATGLDNGNNINAGIYDLSEHDGCIEIPVTATLAEQLTTLTDWGYCWIMQGEGVIVTKIAVTHYNASEQTLWSGDLDFNGWGINWQIGDGTAGAGNPQMFVEAGLKKGQTIRVYLTAYNDWWQVQFFDGHWGGQTEIGTATGLDNGNNVNAEIYSLDEHGGAIEITVTETLLEQLTTLTDWGYCWIMQGEGCRATKITVE